MSQNQYLTIISLMVVAFSCAVSGIRALVPFSAVIPPLLLLYVAVAFWGKPKN